jgi:hypothetical protein
LYSVPEVVEGDAVVEGGAVDDLAVEKRPFDSWAQVGALASRLGPIYGPMVTFGVATGLRPSVLFALGQHDVDRELGVVYVRRAYANGQLKRGGRIDFRSFGRRHWNPAQAAAGIEPVRDLYDMRHTYATFALRAGIPVFAVSRFIGSSVAMIDRHYGHLANDSRQHAVALLDALAFERTVDALRGRRLRHPPSHSQRALPRLTAGRAGGAWTLGGRRPQQPSPHRRLQGADYQGDREAL